MRSMSEELTATGPLEIPTMGILPPIKLGAEKLISIATALMTSLQKLTPSQCDAICDQINRSNAYLCAKRNVPVVVSDSAAQDGQSVAGGNDRVRQDDSSSTPVAVPALLLGR